MAALHQLEAEAGEGLFRVVVESPRGSRAKLKYEPGLDAFLVSRVLPVGLSYPFDWGFVPGTRGPDGDPLDALVLWDVPAYPGLVIPCRPLALLQVQQTEGRSKPRRNDRLLFAPAAGASGDALVQFGRLSQQQRRQLERFFESTTFFTAKELRVLGWQGPKQAAALIRRAAV